MIDLFAGAGGLSLAFEQAGFDVLCAVEYDPIHAATHAFNFPHTEMVCADVQEVSVETVQRAATRGWTAHGRDGNWDKNLDVVIGGPPCQGFSTGGKRASDDHRNGLVFSFARLVGELSPRYFVMENVQGLASFLADETGALLVNRLVDEFRAHGYNVLKPMVLNACAFGVPQDRRRLFLVGAREGQPTPVPPLPTSRGRERRPGSPMPTGANVNAPRCPSVMDAIGDLPDADKFDALLKEDETELSIRATDEIDERASAYVRVLRGLDRDPTDLSYRRSWDPSLLTSSCRTTHTEAVRDRFASTAPGNAETVSRFFRLHPDGIAPTLRAGSHYERGAFNAPRPIHPVANRVITVREAARLHSFPDWFRLHWTKWHGFRQVGNSVPPFVGRAVAGVIADALGVSPSQPVHPIELGDPALLRLENVDAAERLGADLARMPRNALRIRSETRSEAA